MSDTTRAANALLTLRNRRGTASRFTGLQTLGQQAALARRTVKKQRFRKAVYNPVEPYKEFNKDNYTPPDTSPEAVAAQWMLKNANKAADPVTAHNEAMDAVVAVNAGRRRKSRRKRTSRRTRSRRRT
jgi:hypothetical protein